MLTLEQFRAARRRSDNLSADMPADLSHCYASVPGLIYPGDLAIELSYISDDYCLTIGNMQHIGKLDELEAELYAWAVSEEITEVVS